MFLEISQNLQENTCATWFFLIKLQLRRDFEEFCRRMRLKWRFRNESTPYFKESTVFAPKSTCKPPKGHPHLGVKLKKNFLN